MRVVALDPGMRRTGAALSDPSGLIATPARVIRGTSLRTQWAELTTWLRALIEDEDGLEAIVVGVPKHLDGTPTDMTAQAEALAARLERATGVRVVMRDERLTSVAAEQLLATRERDWRKRKEKLDAAAAAVLLQEYLDEQQRLRATS